ncbi:hypothetical protein EK21DRAFT_109971 [Setomelanomma holmii]|uniref:Uncharacterized protein n=1 Tax=Setomelanomma holmii TaxID=210430 RepID=A0A9P4HFE8_9PLEO|nr:hypothetical protein EK21DRAFT_109971 [Setomelanomma holmii]
MTPSPTEIIRNKALLEQLQLEDMLRENIIIQAQHFYGPQFLAGGAFGVIITCDIETKAMPVYTAWIVVYPVPGDFTNWETIACGSGAPKDAVEALQSLLAVVEVCREHSNQDVYWLNGGRYEVQVWAAISDMTAESPIADTANLEIEGGSHDCETVLEKLLKVLAQAERSGAIL